MRRIFAKPRKTNRAASEKECACVQPIRIVREYFEEGKVHIEVVMSETFQARLDDFLRKHGFFAFGHQHDGMALLIEYGLVGQGGEITESRNWLIKTGPEYASMRFKTHEYYSKIFFIAMGLRLHLHENRLLKQLLRERGMADLVPVNEWDDWDDNRIQEFYRRYVFTK